MGHSEVAISASFTLESALLGLTGGLMIGLIASCHLYACGRITGISGMCSALSSATLPLASRPWRLAFLAGLMAVGAIISAARPAAFAPDALDPTPEVAAAAGLLVGVGTKISNGCTSGHGVCGLARLSKRSLVAVVTFLCTGFATSSALSVTGARMALVRPAEPVAEQRAAVLGGLSTAVLALVVDAWKQESSQRAEPPRTTDILLCVLLGAGFGGGLTLSGMTQPSRVLRFLSPFSNEVRGGRAAGATAATAAATEDDEGWDPTLAFVLFGAACLCLASFRVILRCRRPVLGCKFELPTATSITPALVGGAALFGVGWGLAGLCPGPALCVLAAGKPYASAFMACLLAGQVLVDLTAAPSGQQPMPAASLAAGQRTVPEELQLAENHDQHELAPNHDQHELAPQLDSPLSVTVVEREQSTSLLGPASSLVSLADDSSLRSSVHSVHLANRDEPIWAQAPIHVGVNVGKTE